ncbi:MAG: hypothetical protein QM699_00560 [Amaricoccus sp.]|uniref:hypothetical protein n=1 Tax=Amaricoccus sp. TaxID=1872485 RepID=UPI0039E25742
MGGDLVPPEIEAALDLIRASVASVVTGAVARGIPAGGAAGAVIIEGMMAMQRAHDPYLTAEFLRDLADRCERAGDA